MRIDTITPRTPLPAATATPVGAVVSRRQVVAPALRIADGAAASVFAAVRQRGPIARDAVATVTRLSIATVNRQVSALLDAGLLRERADLSQSGAIGRPRVPVEVNHEQFLTVGVHIGVKATIIVATDLFGRTLDTVETPTPRTGQQQALAGLAASIQSYLRRWHRRRVLWIGVAVGGVVDTAHGVVDQPRLGWTRAPVGRVLSDVLALPVSVAAHVDAMAGAELLLGNHGPATPATSLYVYARETVGYALVIDGRVHSPASGPGSIVNLPVRSELLGGTGNLESTVSDEAVVSAAAGIGGGVTGAPSTVAAVVGAARAGDAGAQRVLAERARVLGEAVALLRDLLNPDDLVVGGQAFTEFAEALPLVEQAVAAGSVLPARKIRVTAFGNRVQEAGAKVVALSPLYADPLGTVRRSRRPRVPA